VCKMGITSENISEFDNRIESDSVIYLYVPVNCSTFLYILHNDRTLRGCNQRLRCKNHSPRRIISMQPSP
jgi:hypothetical protein